MHAKLLAACLFVLLTLPGAGRAEPVSVTPKVIGPPALAEEFGLKRLLHDYVALANARDLPGLLELYVPEPVTVKRGKVLEGDFVDSMRQAIDQWERYDAVFEQVEVRSMDVEPERAVVEFDIRASGKLLFLPVSRSVTKRLELTRDQGRWKIVKDVTS